MKLGISNNGFNRLAQKIKGQQEGKVQMFATENDTDKWAVLVDGYFELFDTQSAALGMWTALGLQEEAEDTVFGSFNLLEPGFSPRYRDGYTPPSIDKLSEYEESNLLVYEAKKEKELEDRIRETEEAWSNESESSWDDDFLG